MMKDNYWFKLGIRRTGDTNHQSAETAAAAVMEDQQAQTTTTTTTNGERLQQNVDDDECRQSQADSSSGYEEDELDEGMDLLLAQAAANNGQQNNANSSGNCASASSVKRMHKTRGQQQQQQNQQQQSHYDSVIPKNNKQQPNILLPSSTTTSPSEVRDSRYSLLAENKEANNNNLYHHLIDDSDESDDHCEFEQANLKTKNHNLNKQQNTHLNNSIPKQPTKPMTSYNKTSNNVQPTIHVTKPSNINKADETEFNLSFSGCGFLGIYHVGVATAFSEYAPQLSAHKISGSSAGALVATAHICGNPQLAYAITDFLTVAIDARSRVLGPFHPSFDINSNVREALERGMPENIHEMATGRLHISLTRVHDGENVIVSQFDSKEDVIQALLCSCFIPFWTGLVAPKFKGVSYIDGGFSNNLLVLDDKTITVAPFAGEYDICPQDNTCGLLQINISNSSMSVTPQNLYRLAHALLPSPPEVLSELCEQGFADGIKYLQRMNLISCTKCLEIRSSLLVSTNGEDLEEAFIEEVSHNVDDEITSLCPADSHQPHHHIRLEQQEQKLIQISGRRDSVVSTTSQLCQQTTTTLTTASSETTTTTKTTTRSATSNNTIGNERVGGHMRTTIYVEHEQSTFIVDNCDQCVQIRQRALSDPMPNMLTERIRHACDTVNKSLSNWIYSHRPIKYLSYMAAPYYLPVDISLSLIYKWCWRRLPNVKEELVGCMNGLVEFLIGVITKMDAEKSTSALLLETAGSWEANAQDYEKDLVKHHVNNNSHNNEPNANSCHTNGTNCNNNCNSHHNIKNHGDYAVKITNDGLSVCKLKSSKSSLQLHSLDDTFDSIVDETSNQEARVFAYYFRDSKNRLQVTEIFDRERCGSQADSSSTHSVPIFK